MKRFLVVCFLFSTTLLFAQTQNYQITPELCSLTFEVSAQVHKVNGVSKDFSGTISGDPKDITTSKITIRLDTAHFNTENEKRDRVMREKSLEIEKFPFIEFESTSIETLDVTLSINEPTEAMVRGILKLHGVEREVGVPVRILWDESRLVADGAMDLKLDDYGIFRPKVLFFRLQNDVKIHFRIAAERLADQ